MPSCRRSGGANRGAKATAAVGKAVTVTTPRAMSACSARTDSVASTRARISSAWVTSNRPASVSSAPLGERSKSATPVSRSSVANCWETAEGVYPRAFAVATMVPRTLNSRSNWRRRRSSIRTSYAQHRKDSLVLMAIPGEGEGHKVVRPADHRFEQGLSALIDQSEMSRP